MKKVEIGDIYDDFDGTWEVVDIQGDWVDIRPAEGGGIYCVQLEEAAYFLEHGLSEF